MTRVSPSLLPQPATTCLSSCRLEEVPAGRVKAFLTELGKQGRIYRPGPCGGTRCRPAAPAAVQRPAPRSLGTCTLEKQRATASSLHVPEALVQAEDQCPGGPPCSETRGAREIFDARYQVLHKHSGHEDDHGSGCRRIKLLWQDNQEAKSGSRVVFPQLNLQPK